MKALLCILSITLCLHLHGQHTAIENLVNQIAAIEIPEDFDYYFLLPTSGKTPKISDSTKTACFKKLQKIDHNCPKDIVTKRPKKSIDWSSYALNNAVYVGNKHTFLQTPPTSKTIQFVNYHISQTTYDSLVAHKKPHTLIIKKKWFWNKNRIFKNNAFQNILTQAWNTDEIINKEENIYYQFSTPVFSEQHQYVKFFIIEHQRCIEKTCMLIYKDQDEVWTKLFEFELSSTPVESIDNQCGKIVIEFNQEDSINSATKIVKN